MGLLYLWGYCIYGVTVFMGLLYLQVSLCFFFFPAIMQKAKRNQYLTAHPCAYVTSLLVVHVG